MTAGICDFATWRPVGTFGYPGRTAGQNKPLFFVDHIMAGWKSTMDRPGWQDSAGISAHFGIGKDGSISQYVNIFDASYANGLTGTIGETNFGKEKYDRSNRHLAAVENTPGAMWRFLRLNGIPYWNLIDPNIRDEVEYLVRGPVDHDRARGREARGAVDRRNGRGGYRGQVLVPSGAATRRLPAHRRR